MNSSASRGYLFQPSAKCFVWTAPSIDILEMLSLSFLSISSQSVTSPTQPAVHSSLPSQPSTARLPTLVSGPSLLQADSQHRAVHTPRPSQKAHPAAPPVSDP